jgi:formylmethanofuran dehydrogenase subunit E
MHKQAICGIDLKDFIIRMEEFHGYRSPGLLVGGMMLDIALRGLGSTPYLNTVTETVVCLPDAVQLLTPCTIGNGFLQVLDWGKFALTVYDRRTLSGVRAWLNADKLVNYPLTRQWFERSKRHPQKPPFEKLASEILTAGSTLLGHRAVRLHQALKGSGPVPTGLCPECGESYQLGLGSLCPACQGDAYYVFETATKDRAGQQHSLCFK